MNRAVQMKFGSPDGLSGSASKLRKTKCHDADLLGSTGKDLFGIVSPTSRYCPVPRDKRITINRWCEDNEDADLEGLRQGDPEAVPRGYELFQPDSEDEEDEADSPTVLYTKGLAEELLASASVETPMPPPPVEKPSQAPPDASEPFAITQYAPWFALTAGVILLIYTLVNIF